MFDTVFTSVGSSTELFTVHNNNNKPIKISSITLGGGLTSPYRLNVDGVPGKSFSDVEIGPNDSIWIFVEVTIDPHNQNTPFVVSDSIIFQTNHNLQYVHLVAWGQDAHFHHSLPGDGPLFFIPTNDLTWTNDKPHVIYGYAIVDSGETLSIEQGTNVHIHPGSGIIVLSSGTLKINGTTINPVTIQGDRLGMDYQDVPGQWDRIWFSNLTHSNLVNGTNEIGPGSKNSVIKNAIIKNGNIGLHIDTVFSPSDVTLRLENTIVQTMAGYDLLLRGSVMNAYNCVFANSGLQVTQALYGGTYNFYHCTFANFWRNSSRQDPSVNLNNYFGIVVRPLNAYFGNCILYGDLETELSVDSYPNAAPGLFNFRFDHTIIKAGNNFSLSNPIHYTTVYAARNGQFDPRFVNPDENNYDLDSASSNAIDKGDQAIVLIDPVLNFDIKNNPRPINLPDLGAYERR